MLGSVTVAMSKRWLEKDLLDEILKNPNTKANDEMFVYSFILQSIIKCL